MIRISLKAICKLEGYNLELLKEFKNFTLILDKHRKQSLKKVNPSLYEILESSIIDTMSYIDSLFKIRNINRSILKEFIDLK